MSRGPNAKTLIRQGHSLVRESPCASGAGGCFLRREFLPSRPSAAASAKKLDPTWIAERYLSDGGGYAEKEAEMFVDGARKAGLPDCVPADKLKDMPNLIRVKSCDEQRAKITG